VLIAEKFVFVHQPKTGGTFVRDVLLEIENQQKNGTLYSHLARLGFARNLFSLEYTTEYHDTCRDIPGDHQVKPILSIVRNPFDFYVSFYYFGWWVSHPEDSYSDFENVKRRYPHFPELSFSEFLELANTHFPEFKVLGDYEPDASSPGYYSAQFLLFFFRNPAETYQRIKEKQTDLDELRKGMFDVQFMRTHRLGLDLYTFLARNGYPHRLIKRIPEKEPVRPEEQRRQRPSTQYLSYYNDELRRYVLKKERLLFALFPDLLKSFPKP
jgi:hypothetical protein